jgi:hypothetical protein
VSYCPEMFFRTLIIYLSLFILQSLMFLQTSFRTSFHCLLCFTIIILILISFSRQRVLFPLQQWLFVCLLQSNVLTSYILICFCCSSILLYFNSKINRFLRFSFIIAYYLRTLLHHIFSYSTYLNLWAKQSIICFEFLLSV